MEKRLTRLSGKSYNPQTQVSRKFVDLTVDDKLGITMTEIIKAQKN